MNCSEVSYWLVLSEMWCLINYGYFVELQLTIAERTCFTFITSPAGAVAKYCNEHVCVCVCPSAYLPNHTRDLYEIFMHVAYGRGSDLLRQGDNIPRGRAILGFSPLTMHCTA